MSKKKGIELSNNFSIAETETFQKDIKKLKFGSLYSKIKNYVYPQLKINPFFGTNIKKLRGEFSEIYRYRLGNYRLFYTIDQEKTIIFMMTIKDRKKAY